MAKYFVMKARVKPRIYVETVFRSGHVKTWTLDIAKARWFTYNVAANVCAKNKLCCLGTNTRLK